MIPWQGVFTAMVTPFDDSERVDLDAYGALVERQLSAGIHGIVACGTTAETPTLDETEQESLIRETVRVVRGRAPVVAGVGTNNTRTTVRAVERAGALGADAGLLVFPYYNKPNAEGIRAHVKAALEPGLPLMLYHVPGRTGHRLSASLLAEVSSYPGVIAVKEATGDMKYGGDLLTATRTPILSGDDFTFTALGAMGGAGVVSVVSNVAPAHTVACWNHLAEGRRIEAARALQTLWPLIDFLFAEVNPVPAKAALEALGLCHRRTRLPLAAYAGPSPRSHLETLGLL
jgi:4-hydroxy-tetrahydrodipicolinate synthase